MISLMTGFTTKHNQRSNIDDLVPSKVPITITTYLPTCTKL